MQPLTAQGQLSVQVEQRHDLVLLSCLFTRLQQQPRVMEGKAYDLLHPVDDVAIAYPAQAASRSVTRGRTPSPGTRGRRHSLGHVHLWQQMPSPHRLASSSWRSSFSGIVITFCTWSSRARIGSAAAKWGTRGPGHTAVRRPAGSAAARGAQFRAPPSGPHLQEQLLALCRLSGQALGQNYRQEVGVLGSQRAADHRRVGACGARGEDVVALQGTEQARTAPGRARGARRRGCSAPLLSSGAAGARLVQPAGPARAVTSSGLLLRTISPPLQSRQSHTVMTIAYDKTSMSCWCKKPMFLVPKNPRVRGALFWMASSSCRSCQVQVARRLAYGRVRAAEQVGDE